MAWITSTTPFAGPEAGLAVLAGALVVALPTGAASWRRPPATPGPATTEAGRRPSLAAWTAVTAAIILFELATYVAGELASRHAFPTVSSLYDAASRARAAKAVIAGLWLALGWALFHRQPVGPTSR